MSNLSETAGYIYGIKSNGEHRDLNETQRARHGMASIHQKSMALYGIAWHMGSKPIIDDE